MRTNRIIIAKFAPSAIFVRIVPLSQAKAEIDPISRESKIGKRHASQFSDLGEKEERTKCTRIAPDCSWPSLQIKASKCFDKGGTSVHCLSVTKLTHGTIATVAFRKCSCLFSAQSQVAFTNYFKPDFSDNYQ